MQECIEISPPVPVIPLFPIVPREWQRYCERCGEQTNFVGTYECELGTLGECAKCGEKSVAPFTRTTSNDC